MARVIKMNPPKEKQTECPCGAVIAYIQDDVQSHHGTDYGGGPDGCEWITCPNCGKKKVLRSW